MSGYERDSHLLLSNSYVEDLSTKSALIVMTSSNNVLHPEDAYELETSGLLSASVNGKRKISSSTILTTSSSSSGATSNSGYSDSYSFEVEIPDSLKSKETYGFLGLTTEKAEMLWQR